MNNPNGLTDEQINARPKPYIGMLCYAPQTEFGGIWNTISELDNVDENFMKEICLPGEPNCPWPPSKKFRHEWKEGDKAWVLDKPAIGKSKWFLTTVCKHEISDNELFHCQRDEWGVLYHPLTTPVLYIPKGRQ